MSANDLADPKAVASFFDTNKDDYRGLIDRCVPRYDEMLWALTDYIATELRVSTVLELGCGTGNLTLRLAKQFPSARLTLVDISSEMLKDCRSRLGSSDRFVLETSDFREIDYAPCSFDLVVSSIALHHLTSVEKQQLFQRIFLWLRKGGVFTYSDQFSGVTTSLCNQHMQNWQRKAMALGSTEHDWEVWMEHQAEFDHHDSLADQLEWLRHAGFFSIDCIWRFLLWTVIQASKP